MTYRVVTTMNAKGWAETGRRMVESFVRRWPEQCLPLVLYAEDFEPEADSRVEVRRLPDWLATFKKSYGKVAGYNGAYNGRYDYRFDGVKFAHKVAALTDAGIEMDAGVLVWLDADTFTHSDVDIEWLDGLFPEPAYIAWLDRLHSHPECGFVMYRCSHPYHREFMGEFRRLYVSGDVFLLPETHDSFVLQYLVNTKIVGRKIPMPTSLSGDRRWHHPFVNGPLGARLDHMKGPRKAEGRSRKRDVRSPRSEAYWNGG